MSRKKLYSQGQKILKTLLSVVTTGTYLSDAGL